MSGFPYKTDPFEHQREALRRSSHRKFFGLFMEPGTGKSKVVVDTAGYLRIEDKIDVLIILAPSVVHVEWIREQLPTHMTDKVKWKGFIWRSNKANNKSYQEEWAEWLAFKGLRVLSMNIEAVITSNGKTALRSLVKSARCFVTIDESTDIKSPGSKRTITLRNLAPNMAYRRVLSGLPDPEGPLDLYSQLRFLSPTIVGSSFTSFKNEYAIFEQAPWNIKVPILKGYKNLDRLQKILAEHSFQISKEEAGLNLPEKLYSKRYYELSPEQARMYRELQNNYITSFNPNFLDDDFEPGDVVSAEMAIVRWLRLHQITCGYVPTDLEGPEEPERRIPGGNPRLQALLKVLETTVGPVIVWCRFEPDVTMIMEAIAENEYLGKAVRYDGAVKPADKLKAKDAYTSGEARIFVGNPKAGGRGLTLVNTKTVIFYSQYFGLEPRIQGEDRAHRIGLKHPVLYIDLVAEGTVDERILKRLREKRSLAEMVINRRSGEWI